ncbi:MAG: hypothetical protein CL916_13720 [Deltaproteobacteria bacterium]|nr:hypothetical protein [Deltaproteobacteria bacterium]
MRACRHIILLYLFWYMGCTQSPQEPDKIIDSLDEMQECLNRFPPDEKSTENITEYGASLPTRESALPQFLSQTPLYSNIVSKEVDSAVLYFSPSYQLWSDSADKSRWVYIPECAKIDSSNMDDWQFPVGTRFFKEFSVDGRRVETRMVSRIGKGARDFAFVSYLWNEDETEAEKVGPEGIKNALGTDHDVPSLKQCWQCHGSYPTGGGRPSRGLGFSAMQLNHDRSGVTLEQLVQEERLSHVPTVSIGIPGDEATQEALGYLHANCGSCHNQSTDGLPQFDMDLWLSVEHTSVEETGAWKTAVGHNTQIFKDQHVFGRIVSGEPDQSAIYYRMSQRGNIAQMPPVASKRIDEEGLSVVRQWIEALP